MNPETNVQTLPVLPLKNTVLFPHLFMPLSVGRPSSLAAVEAALATEEKTFVARCGTLLRRACAALPDPYFADEREVEQRGTSAVVEFPITYSLFDP